MARLVGQQSVITITVTDDAGVAVDPATLVARWRDRDGTETSFVYGGDAEVVRTGVGAFKFTAPVFAQPGSHHVRIVTSSPAAALELVIQVAASVFAVP